MSTRIDIPREAIAEFCRRHRIRRLALFGSVRRKASYVSEQVDVRIRRLVLRLTIAEPASGGMG